MDINVLAIVQARMGSTRLPGKVLKKINGKPLIEILLHRLSSSKKIDKIILATSKDQMNDSLTDTVKKLDFEVFRGSEDDVLKRYYEAAKFFKPQVVVRITGDCPIIDPQLVDNIIRQYYEHDVDYTSNTDPPTYPDGLDTEVFSFTALETAHKQATRPYEREHVTPFIRTNGQFKRLNYVNEKDLTNIINNSSFLVLGAAGSIGQALVKELFQRNPKKLYVIDISENNLVELVRDLRSSIGYIKGDFKTFALDIGSIEFERCITSIGNFDYIWRVWNNITDYNVIDKKYKKKFNAIVTVRYDFGTCKYNAKIRQAGDMQDHIIYDRDGFRQSLSIQLKEGNIANVVNFKLFNKLSRGSDREILTTLLFKELGFLAPRTRFVNVTFNGVKNKMLFQENPVKEFLEKNLRREAPMFEGDETLIHDDLWRGNKKVFYKINSTVSRRTVRSKIRWLVANVIGRVLRSVGVIFIYNTA